MVLSTDSLRLPLEMDTRPLVELGQITPYNAWLAELLGANALQKERLRGYIENHRDRRGRFGFGLERARFR